MVRKSTTHAHLGVWSSSLAKSVVHRLLWCHFVEFTHLVRCAKVVTSKWLLQLSLTELDGGMLRRRKVLIFSWALWQEKKRISFTVELGLHTDKLTWLLLQSGNSGRICTVPRTEASQDDLKLPRGVKEMYAEILGRTMVQHWRLEGCRLKTILSSETCTTLIVARKVSFKM